MGYTSIVSRLSRKQWQPFEFFEPESLSLLAFRHKKGSETNLVINERSILKVHAQQ